jgi:hypothetical protein
VLRWWWWWWRGVGLVEQKLFEAFEGEGVARIDIRQEHDTGKLMVLDINPNPSLFYKDECTADTLLRFCGTPPPANRHPPPAPCAIARVRSLV